MTQTKAKNEALACVILAAGKGTRMRSTLPKVMHRIAGAPMVTHVIATAMELKAERIVVVTAPDMQPMRDLLTKGYGSRIAHAVQQEQRGTGDAVKSALPHLEGFEGTVLVLFGDTPLLRAPTLAKALEVAHTRSVTVLGMKVAVPNAYGKLVIATSGSLERIVEAKDAKGDEQKIPLCNSGVMALRTQYLPSILEKMGNQNAAGEYYLTDAVAIARGMGLGCAAVICEDASELLGVNSRTELAMAENIVQNRLRLQAMHNGATLIDPASTYFSLDTRIGTDTVIHPHVVFGPKSVIGSNVEIKSFSHIEGASVADNAIIGPFARLRPGAVIGEGAHIGNFVEIKQSTLGKGAKANHLSYIGDAEVGDATNIGAGTITCNYDGFSKSRTVIGAGAFIGSNTALVAPVAVGDGAIVGAGSVITEDVEANALAIARAPQKQKAGWAKSTRLKKSN